MTQGGRKKKIKSSYYCLKRLLRYRTLSLLTHFIGSGTEDKGDPLYCRSQYLIDGPCRVRNEEREVLHPAGSLTTGHSRYREIYILGPAWRKIPDSRHPVHPVSVGSEVGKIRQKNPEPPGQMLPRVRRQQGTKAKHLLFRGSTLNNKYSHETE